jgi:hypothetical protein
MEFHDDGREQGDDHNAIVEGRVGVCMGRYTGPGVVVIDSQLVGGMSDDVKWSTSVCSHNPSHATKSEAGCVSYRSDRSGSRIILLVESNRTLRTDQSMP